MKKLLFAAVLLLAAIACNDVSAPLPRAQASQELDNAMTGFLQAIADSSYDLHSVMVIQHGQVLAERYFTDPDSAHVLNSVSKSFTAAAVGFAVSEGLLFLDDRIVDIFPESVPENPQERLSKITIRHLLTMNSGHGKDPSGAIRRAENDWVKAFMEWPIDYEPGTCFCYNSLGTYMLSAAVQKVSGQKIVDYLDSRLWQPLGIEKPQWQESPAGINTGGWGLYLKSEDLARMGLCLLNGGEFRGRQVMPADWVGEMTGLQVPSANSGLNEHLLHEIQANPEHPSYQRYCLENNEWCQGYGYQIWQCRHNCFRADGASGQFIICSPEKDAVIVATAQIPDMAQELRLIWKYLLPAI